MSSGLGWMKYLFMKGTYNEDGTWTMPKWAVERWTRQMNTPFQDLPEEEKDTDREEADKFLAIFEQRVTELEDVLRTIRGDAKSALNDVWDRDDDGFKGQIDIIDSVIGEE